MRAAVAGYDILLPAFAVGVGGGLAGGVSGAVARRCGDAAVADYVMTHDLGNASRAAHRVDNVCVSVP